MVTKKDKSTADGGNTSVDVWDSARCHFSEGEKVLACHGSLIYDAKVKVAEFHEKEWRYFIHYLGWNTKWDEWVGMDRILKHNKKNIKKQQDLEKKQGVDDNPKSTCLTHAKRESLTVAKLNKQKTDPFNEDNVPSKRLVKIQIPLTLKKQLVVDWELITQKDKLVILPRSTTVDDILSKYLEYRSKKDGMMTDLVKEVLNGLRCYFDNALPVFLLYKEERLQYHEVVANHVSPSTIYGAEHLLRLFIKLPELLEYINMEEETTIKLQRKLLNFLKFLQKNQSTFFLSAYGGSCVSEGSGKRKKQSRFT